MVKICSLNICDIFSNYASCCHYYTVNANFDSVTSKRKLITQLTLIMPTSVVFIISIPSVSIEME